MASDLSASPQLVHSAKTAVQGGTQWLRDVGQTPQKIAQAADNINKLAPLLRIAAVLLIIVLLLAAVLLTFWLLRLWRGTTDSSRLDARIHQYKYE